MVVYSRTISLFFFLLLATSTFPQAYQKPGQAFSKGFIVRNNGDSITGLIQKPLADSRTLNVGFRSDRQFPAENFSPFDIASFGNRSGSVRYQSVEVPNLFENELSFVRMLVDGPFDLFYYRFLGFDHVLIRDPQNNLSDVTHPPALSMIDTTSLLRRERFLKTLYDIFYGREDLYPAIRKTEPNRRSVTRLLTRYYDRNGIPYKVYGVPQAVLYAGLTAGVNNDIFSFRREQQTINAVLTPSPFAGFELMLVGRKSGLGIFAGNYAGLKRFHYHYELNYLTKTEYYETFIRTFADITRAGIVYMPVSKSRIMPFAAAGGSALVFLGQEYDNYLDVKNESEFMVESFLNHKELNSSFYYGAFLRGGVGLMLANRRMIKFSAGYSFYRGSDEKLNSVDLSASYFFRHR